MTKKSAIDYEITKHASGAFTVAGKRYTYNVDPGTVAESDLAPAVLDRLKAKGIAVKAGAGMTKSSGLAKVDDTENGAS